MNDDDWTSQDTAELLYILSNILPLVAVLAGLFGLFYL